MVEILIQNEAPPGGNQADDKSRSAIANGYAYTVRRNANWPEGVIAVTAKAVDPSGNASA